MLIKNRSGFTMGRNYVEAPFGLAMRSKLFAGKLDMLDQS